MNLHNSHHIQCQQCQQVITSKNTQQGYLWFKRKEEDKRPVLVWYQLLDLLAQSWYWILSEIFHSSLVRVLSTFWNFHTNLILVSGLFQTFQTSLALILGPRLIFGWYQAGISLVFETGIKLVQGWYNLRSIRGWYKASIVSGHTSRLGSLIPLLIPGTSLYCKVEQLPSRIWFLEPELEFMFWRTITRSRLPVLFMCGIRTKTFGGEKDWNQGLTRG